jgi:hypothetical protein
MTIDEAARKLSAPTPIERVRTCRAALDSLERTIQCASPEVMPELAREWQDWQDRLAKALEVADYS